ncbi:MAG: hypothetical protein JNK73_10735 [Bacteroidia bacterium]|nr:hypothetical protein [Bacteroidia bacterium]
MKLSDQFNNVKRTALVLTAKQPLYDWVISINPKYKVDADAFKDPDVYLLPDFETTDQMERWLKKNFDWLFCEQLNNWYVDEDLWVQNRTFKMFKEWFSYSLHPMVWDSVEGPIDKIEYD